MSDPENGRFMQDTQERVNTLTSDLLFFTLEINRIDNTELDAKLVNAGFQTWDQLVRYGNISLRPLRHATPIEIGRDIRITPFLVPHRQEYSEVVGFRIDGPSRAAIYLNMTARAHAFFHGMVFSRKHGVHEPGGGDFNVSDFGKKIFRDHIRR